MTDHLRMKGKDALTIEEGEALLYHQARPAYYKACNKLGDAIDAAKDRRDTREHMRKMGAEAAKKAGVKIKPEEGD